MSTSPDTYIAVTEVYWTTVDQQGTLLGQKIYDAIGSQVEGFVGIWNVIERFCDKLDKAYDWAEVDFFETVELYVKTWQERILAERRPIDFDEVHVALSQKNKPAPAAELLEKLKDLLAEPNNAKAHVNEVVDGSDKDALNRADEAYTEALEGLHRQLAELLFTETSKQ